MGKKQRSIEDYLWSGVLTREEFDELLNMYGRAVWNVAYAQGREDGAETEANPYGDTDD